MNNRYDDAVPLKSLGRENNELYTTWQFFGGKLH